MYLQIMDHNKESFLSLFVTSGFNRNSFCSGKDAKDRPIGLLLNMEFALTWMT